MNPLSNKSFQTTALSSKVPSVSVVIPVFNQAHLTERCLSSLFKNSHVLKEVFVINNGSHDNTAALLEHFRSQSPVRFEIVTNLENRGFGRAVNQGLRLCTGDQLVVLNNDTWLMPGWDAALVSELSRLQVDFIGPYFYEKPFTSEEELKSVASRFVARNHGHVRSHFVPILMMMTRAAFDQLKFDHGGLFDERFFVTYEDTDVVERLRALRMTYAQSGSCLIWHHSKATRSVPGALPPTYEQEGLRLFIEKWGFDPRPRDHTWLARARRRWWRLKEKFGVF